MPKMILEVSDKISEHLKIQRLRHNMKDQREYISKLLEEDYDRNAIPSIKRL